MSNTYTELTKIFEDVLSIDNIKLDSRTTANMIDGWDSLNNIRLMVTIEKVFNIRFATSEITGLNTVGELVQLIEKKSNK